MAYRRNRFQDNVSGPPGDKKQFRVGHFVLHRANGKQIQQYSDAALNIALQKYSIINAEDYGFQTKNYKIQAITSALN